MNDARDASPGAGEALRRVADCWDRAAVTRRENPVRGWLDSYYLASKRLNAPVSGSPSVIWLIGLARRLEIPPSSRWLSIGCGAAGQEVGAAEAGLFESLDAIDIARSALDEGRRLASAAGVEKIRFIEGDFHRLPLGSETYDVVFMNMSLHHVEELDALCSGIAACLRQDGYLLLNEYVGPRQFQFPDRQLEIVRRLLEALPEGLRRDLTSGEVKRRYERRSVEYWNVADPSEAIRSDLIVPTLERTFDVVERIDYGGTILHLLLEHIIHNFDPGSEYHLTVLDLLAAFEDVLIELDVLASDFTVMALRRKDAPPLPAPVEVRARERPGAAAVERENERLHAELAKAWARVDEIERSRGWQLVQGLRGLLGRRW